MSIKLYQNSLNQVDKDIANLEKKLAYYAKSEAEKTKRINSIEKSITKNTSVSSLNSKLKQISSLRNELSRIVTQKADINKKIAEKRSKRNDLSIKIQKEQEKQDKKEFETRKLVEETYKKQIADLTQAINSEVSRVKNSSNLSVYENNSNEKYDVFICGSDQIWYPFFLENDSQDYYFASFSNKKKIAYAPSIGVKSMPEYLKTKMNKLVSQFSYISAREIEGCKILGDIVNKEVTHVVDPTLLLNSSQWAKLLSHTSIKGGYILLYLLTYNKKYVEVAFGFARQHKLPIKIFFTQKEYYTIPCEKIYGAGPIEFLNQIKNAEYMLTDSFHGSIFSYIFKTQFVTFKRFKDDSELSQNSRVENLLSELGLSQYLIGEDDCSRINRLEKIDFELAEQHINPLIGKSKSYLINALKDNR